MVLKQLSLVNFKNYSDVALHFSPKMNCLVGNNGMGKTNILDAIHYLSFCKSFFNPVDSQNIKHGEGFFVIQGSYSRNGEDSEVYCGQKRNQKKIFKHDKKEYERLSEHIGMYPLVMISPADAEIINGTSEVRRKFIDGIISQYDKVYLEKLIAYNQVLKQRNALLKQFWESRSFDTVTLEIWDEQLIIHGKGILQIRLDFLREFIPLFNKHYAYISESREQVSVEYESSIGEKDYKTAIITAMERDRVLHYTTVGPHKDDMDFTINGFSLKKFASQGQQKSFLLALKLAQFEFIKNKKNTKPLLLLDDVYDKLDEARFRKLIELVSGDDFGQVFITDTHPDRIRDLFAFNHIDKKIFLVDNGVVEEMK
jgi:DNA replication and repair protein RecF